MPWPDLPGGAARYLHAPDRLAAPDSQVSTLFTKLVCLGAHWAYNPGETGSNTQ